MGRTGNPLYKDPHSGNYFARWYEGKKRIMLSLNTSDPIEAMKRLPIVQTSKLSWNQYQKTFTSFSKTPITTIQGVGPHTFNPPITWKTTNQGVKNVIEGAIKLGIAKYDKDTKNWIINNTGEKIEGSGDVLNDLHELKKVFQNTNNAEEIEEFYTTIMPQLYTDKVTANRNTKIWLDFLNERNITSWSQITEALCVDFKKWRKYTKLSKNGREGVFPSDLVINRHMKFLDKSFAEAVHRGYLKNNPIRNWKPESHIPPLQESLTVEELCVFFSHKKLLQDYLMNGLERVPLGYRLLDVYLLLFTSCKRRGEIIKLLIEDLNFDYHYAYYTETKNSSRCNSYRIHKAFWLTPDMECLLKRLIGNRTSGPILFCPSIIKKSNLIDEGYLNPDYISQVFKNIACEKFPEKNISLHNLRHTATDILEKAGLTDEEIDATLGHHPIKTALIYYKDRSADAIARRIAERTRKGIEVLSKTIKTFF